MGDLNSSEDSSAVVEIPSRDKNTALTLLLEFAVQKGSLNEMLDMVRLLLTIWTLGRERQDNRTGSGKVESSAPLVPFLRRLEAIGNYTVWKFDNFTATQFYVKSDQKLPFWHILRP